MKRFYQMFLVLALVMLGATTASGQKIYRAELDKSMFKAWNGCGADAEEVADPQPIDVTDENPNGTKFSCDFNLYKEIGQWSGIYGSTAAYYLWYADLTGTKKMYFTGTPGFKFYVQFNRAEPNGSDAHGGDMVQQELTIADDGTATYDIPETMTYVHLNCIKTKGIEGTGVLRSIEIEGTVKPVTGILSWINNGDAEGDDLASFPVSFDGPNNGSTAPDLPEIVVGGVSGKCFKVKSHENPTESWHTQFFIKTDDVIPAGTKWKLTFSAKASEAGKIGTSSQGDPRTWRGSFVDAFDVTTEWQEYTFTGTIADNITDFHSVAFDLNNGDIEVQNTAGTGTANVSMGRIYYFDNIQFGEDLGGANPMSDISLAYGGDVICINLAGNTNMKKLVEAKGITIAKGVQSLIFNNSCVTVTYNNKKCNIASVEGRPDGNLYIFLDDMDGEGGTDFNATDANVVVAFTNPEDADYHLTFAEGRWAGEPIPDFSGLVCDYKESLGDGTISSYLYEPAKLASANPEDGSFQLAADTKDFEVTFSTKVDATTIVAKLGEEDLTVSPAEGEFETFTLTRTAQSDLSGTIQLVISEAVTDHGYELDGPITLNYSFGPITSDPDDQPAVLIPASYFEGTPGGGIPEGFIVNFQGTDRPGGTTGLGSGPRMMTYNDGGDFTRALYFREGYTIYGTTEGYELTLAAGKKYDIQFNTMMWKDNGKYMKFEILDAEDIVCYSEIIESTLNINGGTNSVVSGSKLNRVSFTPEADGNYKLKWTSTDANGNQGYSEVMLAKVIMSYTPNVAGLAELALVDEALNTAKQAEANNNADVNDGRYLGAAYTALVAKIAEYDGVTFTAPSVCQKAADELNAAAQAMSDHHTACDTYDALPAQAQALVDDNADKKFANTNFYPTLKTTAAKYIVEKTDEGYTFKVLTDDDELATATAELQNVINIGKALFTEGKSTPENSNGGKGTGIAVETERLRLGVEGLKALGVAEDDALLVKANNALTDDDALAEDLMLRTKHALYGKLKDNENIFQKTTTTQVANPDYNPENPVDGVPEFIDETETVAVSYDMTVFVKNPNIYKQEKNMNFTPENVPAWSVPEGYNAPGMTVGWGAPKNYDQVAEDCMLSNWGNAYRVEQTITDLPAGKYTVSFGFGERQDEASNADNLVYAKTSTEEEFTAQPKVIGQAFPFADGTSATVVEDVEVTDGILTIGVNAGQGSHVFFNDVRIILTGAADVDYASLYEALPEMPTAIETLEGTPAAKVRAIEMFDLNGRRVTKAQKGLVIMKQIMSDGTVRTQKVVK